MTKRLTVVPGTPLVPGETVDVMYGPANLELEAAAGADELAAAFEGARTGA